MTRDESTPAFALVRTTAGWRREIHYVDPRDGKQWTTASLATFPLPSLEELAALPPAVKEEAR